MLKVVYWKDIFRSPKWFLTRNLPFAIRYWTQSCYMPQYKTIAFNSRFYDGMTRNNFIKGDLIRFLYKVGIIKQTTNLDDVNGRGYWIGCTDD